MPARKNEFEQLCECLRQKASLEWDPAAPLVPWLYLFFLKAENSFCHLDLLFRVMGGAEAIVGKKFLTVSKFEFSYLKFRGGHFLTVSK